MTHRPFRGAAAALALALALPAAPAAAQSLLAARGLGYLLEASDARSRGLGGVTTGLPEPRFSLVNPAEPAGLPAAGLTLTFHADHVTPEEGLADDFESTRFPSVQAAFPIGSRLVASLGYASVLDQNWAATRLDSLELAGERREVRDRFVSEGGVARLRAGVAYRFGRRLDVGAAADVYTGALRDSTLRQIEGLQGTGTGAEYRWSGAGLSAGARWRGDALTLSAAVAGGGNLRAIPRDSTLAEGSYGLPLRVDGGASARVAQTILLSVSGRWMGWSSADGDLAPGSGGARDVLQGTAGVEVEGLRLLGRPLPLRLGARLTQLPFSWDGTADYPDERALTGGVGIRFAGGAAQLDLSGERGTRGPASLGESFWRGSLSLSLVGR